MLLEVLHGVVFLSPVSTVRVEFTSPHYLRYLSRTCYSASYDYGASIMENREITPKFDELKLQGLFLRSSPQFYKTDWIGNSSTDAVTVSNDAAFVVKLQNPDSGSGFYIARQASATST